MRLAGRTSPVGTNQRQVSPRKVFVAGRVSEVEEVVDVSVEGVAVCCAIAGNATPSSALTAVNLSSCLMTGTLQKSNKRSYFTCLRRAGQTRRLRSVVGLWRSFATKDPGDADA